MRLRTLLSTALLATTATISGSVLSAEPAAAVPTHTWERLAQCESGKRWHINTGNGYYGGLQFSLGTWRAFSGPRVPDWPHRATKKEQIRIAERVKRHQGWGAWPACSEAIGLR